MAAGPRHKDEPFEQYRARLKSEQQLEDVYLGGWWERQEKPRGARRGTNGISTALPEGALPSLEVARNLPEVQEASEVNAVPRLSEVERGLFKETESGDKTRQIISPDTPKVNQDVEIREGALDADS